MVMENDPQRFRIAPIEELIAADPQLAQTLLPGRINTAEEQSDVSPRGLAHWRETHLRMVYAPASQRLWDNKVLRCLSGIRLDHTIYPFTLKGEKYLNSRWKRGLDFTVGVVGSLLSFPIIAVAVAAIKISVPEKSPLISRFRHGRNNQQFNMYKIRSQREDTSINGEIKPIPVGRFLRVMSIDELPQFWNVVIGHMSVVGRRPTLPVDYEKAEIRLLGEVPYEKAKSKLGFTDEKWNSEGLAGEFREKVVEAADVARRYTRLKYEAFVANHYAKPGLSGLYQVLGRRDLALEDRVLLDLVYERRIASLGLDLAIIISTVWAVVKRKGAK